MRSVTRIAALAAGLVVTQLLSSVARATDYTWSNLAGGTTAWDLPANWGGGGFPNLQGDKADINVALTNDLRVNLPGIYTVSGLIIGSTGSAVTTDIGNANSTGNALIFNNGPVSSPSYLYSRGVAGVTNVISAPIRLSGDNLVLPNQTTLRIGDPDGVTADPLANQRSLVLNGTIQPVGGDRNLQNNLLGNGSTLTINGDIILSGGPDVDNLDPAGRGRRIQISAALTSTTIINGKFIAGPLPTASVSGASGSINLGSAQNPSTSGFSIASAQPPQYQLNADNTGYTGQIVLNRGTYYLNSVSPFGSGEVRGGNPSGPYGFNLIAGSDNFHFKNSLRTVQNFTIRGSNSIIFDEVVFGTQNRAFVNLLPAGKSVTMSKAYYTAANTGDSRTAFFDGIGTTYLEGGAAGGIRNYWNGSTSSPLDDNAGNGGTVLQRGTGRLIVNGTGSTFRGAAMSSGGLLEFATAGSYGVQADNGTGVPNAGAAMMLTNPGGAIGVRTGSLEPTFLNLFTRDYPSAFGNMNDSAGNQVGSRGAIALSTVDAASNIDFNAGDFTNTRLQGVSIGALSGGVSYTGTITPANNTYRLGGGDTLTMANANQLTGARNLEVVNGGTVVLAQANNYSGTTTVQGSWISTGLENAQNSLGSAVQNYTIPDPLNPPATINVSERPIRGVRIDPVLEVKKLDDVNGSSLGTTSAIRLRGGTLKYSGSTNDSTNKTLTIGSVGATLDSSGAGTISFANASAATLEDQADITSLVDVNGTALSATATTINFGQNDPLLLANVGVGWTVAGPGIPVTATINAIATGSTAGPSNQTTVLAYLRSDSGSLVNAPGASTYTFTNQNRILTLTGSNAGNNVVANALGNSVKGTLGITKTGAGTWILSGNNTYTGPTTINGGTLGVGSVNALGATSGTTINGGGTLAIATPAATAVKIDNAKLTRNGGSKIDMLKGKLVLDYTGASPLSTVKADIVSGYAGGAFNGSGITTSDSASGKKLRVGYAEAFQVAPGGTWFGQSVDADAILLAGTFAGDTNLDGTVNFDDLLKLAQNYGGTGKEWIQGDSDYNGSVNFDDLLALAQSYSAALVTVSTSSFEPSFAADWALAASLVPEPVSLGGILAMGMLAGRRRRA